MKKIKILSVFLSIFALGMVTGAAITPVVSHGVAGNPYSMSVLAERIYNTNFLKNKGLTEDQREAVDFLTAEYVLKYTAERDVFMARRRTLYNEFKFDLEKILTPYQFNAYVNQSDRAVADKEAYNKNMELLWREKRDAQIAKTHNRTGDDLGLGYIQVTVTEKDIMPGEPAVKDTDEGSELDFLNKYIIDRIKYKWTTYSSYQELHDADKVIDEPDIIP